MAAIPYVDITLWAPLTLGVLSLIVVAIWGEKADKAIKSAAIGLNAILMGLLLYAYSDFKSEYLNGDVGLDVFAFETQKEWIPSIGASYHVGVDGLSYPLIVMTTVVFLASLVYSWNDSDNAGLMFSMFLILEAGLIGTFVALDLVLFFVAWELVLVPMWIIILRWGDPRRRRYAAYKLLIYTHLFSLFMLIGFMYMYLNTTWDNATGHTFDLVQITLQYHENAPSNIVPVFALLTMGFAVKFPIVPIHTWLPDAHVEAPSPGSAVLAGLLLKMGTYGMLRIAIGTFRDFDADYHETLRWILGIFGTVSISYSAFVALRQSDLKKMIAYSSVGHMGFVMLAYAAFTVNGLVGAMYMSLAHGVISPMLFLISGTVQHIAGTREIPKLGGLGTKAQLTGSLMVFSFFASAGLPGCAGFVAELIGFIGVFEAGELAMNSIWFWLGMIGVISIIVVSAYYVWALQRAVMGPVSEAVEDAHEAPKSELIPLFMLAIIILLMGVFPQRILEMLQRYAEQLVNR